MALSQDDFWNQSEINVTFKYLITENLLTS